MGESKKMRDVHNGENLRLIRKKRKMSMADLANAASAYLGDSEEQITESMIGRWERGESRIFADQVLALAKALHCTGAALVGGHSHTVDAEQKRIEFLEAFAEFPPDAKEILWFLTNRWDGNMLALIYMLGMYAMTPEEMRMDGAGMIIHQYRQAVSEGVAGKEIHPDIDYLEKSWEALSPKKAKNGYI